MGLQLNIKKSDNVKLIKCPCCGQTQSIRQSYYYDKFDWADEEQLINSTKEFFDLIIMCPSCYYTMLDIIDTETDDIKAFVRSDEYRKWLSLNLDMNLKKWILYALINEHAGDIDIACIAYLKAYDYMELKNLSLNSSLIDNAISLALQVISTMNEDPMQMSDEDKNYYMLFAIIVIDSLRRISDRKSSHDFIVTSMATYVDPYIDLVCIQEQRWLEENNSSKQIIPFSVDIFKEDDDVELET